MIWLLTLAVGADQAGLGSPKWETREAAHAKLKAAGALAWPLLWPALDSPDPETRARVGWLLKPAARLSADLDSLRWVFTDRDPLPLWFDMAARERLSALLIELGCYRGGAPEDDPDAPYDLPYPLRDVIDPATDPEEFCESMASVRAHVRRCASEAMP